MPRLEHWNVRTFDLPATIAFYEDVVGLRSGHFPGRLGSGAWLYDDAGVPVVHVVRLDPLQRDREMARLAERLGELASTIDLEYAGSGVVDHVAFACDDLVGMRARIDQHGLPYRLAEFPHLGLVQILVNDPNGVTLELNFREAAAPSAQAAPA